MASMVIDPSWPAGSAPPGVVPNFDDPPSRKMTIIVLLAVFVPLMLLVVAARIYVRTCIMKIWGAEDTSVDLSPMWLSTLKIIAKLLAEDPHCTIHCIDINTTRNIHISDSVTYHKGNLSSLADVSRIMELARPVTIFHTASPEFSDAPESAYHDVIVTGTHHLLNSAATIGTVKAFINTSTSGVINDNHTDLINGTEDMPILRPPVQKRLYCLAKADAEEAIQAANRQHGFLTCALRPCLTFGERDTNSMGKMVAVARAGRSRFQMGHGKNAYDFVYVDNLADAHLLAAHALVDAHANPPLPADRRVEGEVFNIMNGEPWLFWDFQREISKQLGFPVQEKDIVVIPKWVGLLMGFEGGEFNARGDSI
ncbi:3-beta hydroxysteroid dehydrogenase/isomerase family-domain-containing protein [Aspergillus spinulosporus]